MQHFFDGLPGWLTFENFYKEMVVRFPSNSTFVEVGVFAGRSFAFLGVEIANSGKDIDLIGVDNFGFVSQTEFDKNMLPLAGRYRTICGDSAEAANAFADGSVDFCFIDANHDESPVLADIRAWLPKIRMGGCIAGHDVGTDEVRPWPGVIKAVRDVFGDCFRMQEDCWIVDCVV